MNQTITGTGFTGATLVTYVTEGSLTTDQEYEVGTGARTFSVISDTEIQVRDVPVDYDGQCWGVFDIEVSGPNGSGTLTDGFRVAQVSIATVTPERAPTNAEQVFTLTGRDFDLVTSATYTPEDGTASPLPFSITDETTMTVTMPPLGLPNDWGVIIRLTAASISQTTQRTIHTVAA